MDKKTFISKLENKNFDFLKDINFEKLEKNNQLKDIFDLNDGSAYYFSFILGHLGLYEDQIRFLKLEMNEGIWKEEALKKVYDILSSREMWPALSTILIKYFENEGYNSKHVFLLHEALYKMGNFSDLIRLSESTSIELYYILSLIETDDKLWYESMESFILKEATLFEMGEIYSLVDKRDLLGFLDPSLNAFMVSVSFYNEQNYRDLVSSMSEVNFSDQKLKENPSFLYTIRQVLEKSGKAQFWADRLASASTFASTFNSGRIYMSLKNFVLADSMFRKAISLAETEYEEDRSKWYLINLYKNNVYKSTSLIKEFSPLWNNPSYFNDLLLGLLAKTISSGNWKAFKVLFESLESYGEEEVLAAYSWVKYLAYKSNIIVEQNPTSLIANMLNSEAYGFYNLIGHLLSNKKIEVLTVVDEKKTNSEKDKLILGFIKYGLIEEAIVHSKGNEKKLSIRGLRILSEKASSDGNYIKSISLISHVKRREAHFFSLGDLQLFYPNAYNQLISTYSNKFGIEKSIISGLIRSESAFMKEIFSVVGASGLTQLMPATAMEEARKLKINHPNLSDPETNIHIGTSYLKWIEKRPWTENYSQISVAYNAGGGTLRKWKRVYPHYREELFAELIPYLETRHYLKKMITSSIIYGLVYNDVDPLYMINKFYPDFETLILK